MVPSKQWALAKYLLNMSPELKLSLGMVTGFISSLLSSLSQCLEEGTAVFTLLLSKLRHQEFK